MSLPVGHQVIAVLGMICAAGGIVWLIACRNRPDFDAFPGFLLAGAAIGLMIGYVLA